MPFVIVWFSCAKCWAGFDWMDREKSVTPLPGEQKAETTFSFTNRGDSPVKILVITSCCNCTSGVSSKPEFAPGETGTVTAIFAFGERVGLHEKYLIVHTNDPKEPASVLTMRVQIPEVLTLTPSFVSWEFGEPLQTKDIRIQLLDNVTPESVHVTSSDPNVKVKVVSLPETKEGKVYQVRITPSAAKTSFSASLNIEVALPGSIIRTFNAQVRVLR